MTGKVSLKWIQENRGELVEVSDKIWAYAEPGLKENKSAELQAKVLQEAGFEVKIGVAGMPSALVATWGSGKPVIGLLGEYDALPGISQKAVPHQEPLEAGAAGHGCGHNLLGTAAMGAAMAIKEEMQARGLAGTIRYYGCPAEETLVGKVFMVRDGLFDDVDASLTWHPGSTNSLWGSSSLALNSAKFKFFGRSSHAAGNPQAGRSALDAVELMNVGVNFLREHVTPKSRIHYVITNGGGEPNVVPPEAEVWYYVRAPEREEVDEIYKRIVNIAEGATLMTETTYEVEFLSGCYNMLPNDILGKLLHDTLVDLGAPEWDEDDEAWARKHAAGFVEGSREKSLKFMGRFEEIADDVYLHNSVTPIPEHQDEPMGGSTDVADVSWVTPTAQFTTACGVIGMTGHSWQFVASSGMSIGHKGMFRATEVLALAGLRLIEDAELLDEAKKEFAEATADKPYESPLPEGMAPPLHQLDH